MPTYWENERTEYLEYPDVIWKVSERFFALPNHPITYSGNKSELLGYTVGALRGSLQSEHLANLGVAVDVVNDHTQNILKVASGHIDAMIAPEKLVQYKLRILNSNGDVIVLKMLGTPYKVFDLHVAFSKAKPNSKTLSTDFNRGLKAIQDSGKFDRIIAEIETTQIPSNTKQ